MKYPIMSNWITVSAIDNTDSYSVYDCLTEERFIANKRDIEFIRKLDGKTNPNKLLRGLTKDERYRYLKFLEYKGLIRTSMRIDDGGFLSYMRTLIIIRDNHKYKGIASVLNLLLILAFIPVIVTGMYRYVYCLMIDTINYDFGAYLGLFYVLGYIIGNCLGLLVHELSHAISATAYDAGVKEFGVMINIYPAAYTLIDSDCVRNRLKKIQIDLAGVESNFLLAGISLHTFTWIAPINLILGEILVGVAVSNLLLGLVNLLMISGTDGMHIIELLIGGEDVIDSTRRLFRNRRRIKQLGKSQTGRIQLVAAGIFSLTRLIYPAIIVLNIVSIVF